MTKTRRTLLLPQLVDPDRKPWTVTEVDLVESAVDTQFKKAYVPPAYSEAQKLARIHELGHVKYSPNNWYAVLGEAMGLPTPRITPPDELDPAVVLHFLKMVEENRIDWLLWSRHGADIRPAREALAWDGMPLPDSVSDAVGYVLQLCWTVWASRGISKAPNAPPVRDADEETAEFFDKCWAIVLQHPQGQIIAQFIVSGCLSIYSKPTHTNRNRIAVMLAQFFPKKPPPQPDEKEEEKEEQQEAEEQEKQQQQQQADDAGGTAGVEVLTRGHVQIHDHTGVRRRQRAPARSTLQPMPYGQQFKYPHRHVLDRNVFARKKTSTVSIMIDTSGSMKWTNEMLMALIDRMPSVWIGTHESFRTAEDRNVYGRICILAKNGVFAEYQGREPGSGGGNAVDIEALEELVKWPGPRFWLSDGYVWGGPREGPYPDLPEEKQTAYLRRSGAIMYRCHELMKRYNILRVNTMEDMLALLERKAVTVYTTCVNQGELADRAGRQYVRNSFGHTVAQIYGSEAYPPDWTESPLRYQL